MNTCYIVCALDCALDINPEKTDFVIGADGGYSVLEKNGIKPNAVIGDFDSYDGEIECDKIVRFPVKKDFTDSDLAIKYAIECGFEKIRVYGAIGGALDHTIANLSLLGFYTRQGIDIAFIDGENVVFGLVDSSVEFSLDASGRISVFSFDDTSLGVSERGLLYELYDAELHSSVPIGVSNEFVGKKSEISVRKGTLMLCTSKKNFENYLTKR